MHAELAGHLVHLNTRHLCCTSDRNANLEILRWKRRLYCLIPSHLLSSCHLRQAAHASERRACHASERKPNAPHLNIDLTNVIVA
jgi:hypothetical protein